MIRFLFRLTLRIVTIAVLAVTAFLLYHLYTTDQLPGLKRAVEDTSVTGATLASIKIHKTLSSRPIRVTSDEGVVTLRGRVASSEERSEALDLVGGIGGVNGIVDELTIDASLADESSAEPSPSLGQRLDDTALLAKIRAALHLDQGTRDLSLELSVAGGVVVLGGEVPTADAAEQALTRVRSVSGVESVESRLEILEPQP